MLLLCWLSGALAFSTRVLRTPRPHRIAGHALLSARETSQNVLWVSNFGRVRNGMRVSYGNMRPDGYLTAGFYGSKPFIHRLVHRFVRFFPAPVLDVVAIRTTQP